MSADLDGLTLSQKELSAMLALGGKRDFYGFLSDQDPYTEEQLWNTCCGLMSDGLMTLSGGRFQLREDLYQVVVPILDAAYVLVLWGHSGKAEVMYYFGEHPVAVELALTGACSLRPLDEAMLLADLRERSCIQFYDPEYPVMGKPVLPDQCLDTPVEQLLSGSDFLLTLLHMERQTVTAWLRGTRQGMEPWLETVGRSECRSSVLTEENLIRALEKVLEEVPK